ncbi:MAG: toll/interleukin-1 receptor domain-containing protein [Chitinophagales bacterium]|nr:toll/interleukin-1 receptor domain-containing protein [Hyphomicrobiales bacterium]
MADIFISYSQKNRDDARLLAAFSRRRAIRSGGTRGWRAGEQFRNEIMEALNEARAVVVIRSEESAKSVWVQSEAGRAQADRKLVPVKSRLMSSADIPPPFENLHTPNLDDRDAVLSAVQLQLAKPPAPPVLWKQARYEALTWFGIVGSAVTIFTNASGLRELANWAKWLGVYWHWASFQIFSWIGSLFRINIPQEISGFLIFIVFIGAIFISSLLIPRNGESQNKRYAYCKLFALFPFATGLTLIISLQYNVYLDLSFFLSKISIIIPFTYIYKYKSIYRNIRYSSL